MNLSSVSPPVAAQRLGLWAIGMSLLAFLFWMWLAPLEGAVVTVGLVKAETNRKFVQHTDGGIVKRILVRNGDRVREGQSLVELDDVKLDANHQLLQELMVFETLKRERLDAEQQLAPRFEVRAQQRIAFDRTLANNAFQRELRIFRTRRALLDEQLASYQRQLRAVIEEQAALQRQMDASREAVRLAREELALNETLVHKQFISRARVITFERSVAEYSAKQGEHEALLAQSEQRRNDLALRLASARSEYQRIAAEEFKETNAQLVQLREQLRPLEDAARRKSVVAPVSGTVVGLRLNAPGEVAPAREPLMEIVPDNEALVVEAQVGVDAIKHLRAEQGTELRFTTFNARTTPLVRGSLSYISADALTDKDGQPYYVIQVRAPTDALRAAGIPAIKPGMAAEVYVLLESRSVIDYLISPITDTLRRALREP
ncbi:HlyD family type I secretion periplasmic adaptor subunit [Aromatoleum anaerobium]|uniref:Membrane fusion protein (MFP) family protein n=1 Tax=Aromatoleum anaerobium TaxID=182180 RepID=A0ABX1PQ53_9RHOO|nr:HlyD family type I secretion periplasmic adaptor subunit [Aromatoleum anaerobium]MCK0505530.1 HlyD family type I secretion periplasmic adaptor subunit [Aromatoleum anaerobium]